MNDKQVSEFIIVGNLFIKSLNQLSIQKTFFFFILNWT